MACEGICGSAVAGPETRNEGSANPKPARTPTYVWETKEPPVHQPQGGGEVPIPIGQNPIPPGQSKRPRTHTHTHGNAAYARTHYRYRLIPKACRGVCLRAAWRQPVRFKTSHTAPGAPGAPVRRGEGGVKDRSPSSKTHLAIFGQFLLGMFEITQLINRSRR
jgi:hypothetical protein